MAVEAKRIDVDSRDEMGLEQLAEYVLSIDTVSTAVLTNGQYWEIFLKDEHGEWDAACELPLGLHWHETPKTAERLYKHLAKEKFWRSKNRRGTARMRRH